jgi:hypothetical protein
MPTLAAELILFLSSFSPLFVVFGLLESFGAGALRDRLERGDEGNTLHVRRVYDDLEKASH